jgi:hypothetical protein
MGRDEPSDGFGGPQGWSKLLERFKNEGAPIINAAHFGGDLAKPVDGNGEEHQWPKAFASLMAESNGTAFYGDLGYWTALRRCGVQDDNDCKASLARIRAAQAAFPRLAERVMYGSDWMMMSREVLWQSYAVDLARALSDVLPAERVFYRNAVECFGLVKNGQNRRRVDERLAGIPGGSPEWLRSA